MKKQSPLPAPTRRDFLKTQSAAALSLAMFATSSPLQRGYSAETPNERCKIGFIGCGGMGRGDARELAHFGDVVALADVDKTHSASFRNDEAIVKKPNEVLETQDYRRILDRDDIEVVGIATPDHWHVKIAVEALLAGKHVFCQKPLTLTIEENQLVRAAVRKTGKVFLVGTQQRTDRDRFATAALMVRKGMLGDIRRIVVTLNTGPSGGPFQKQNAPEHLDWNFFLGQAPYVDYIPQRASGAFRYWHEYSGGQLTDWGAHHIDCALWALDQDREGCGPVEFDGREADFASELDERGYPKVDNFYNTATNFKIKTKFENGVEMLVESKKDFNGILFEGTKGRIFVDRGRITGKPIEENRHQALTDADFIALNHDKPLEWTKANFFRCIREGGLPSSDVFSHTISMNSCHLCAIAARLKRVVRWDPKTETILGDGLAASFLRREQRKGFELPTLD